MRQFILRLALVSAISILFVSSQVQAVVTIEYLVLMTVIEGQTTRVVESKVDGWILSEDLITGPGQGGGPHVRVFSGVDSTQLFELACSDAVVSEATVMTTIRDDQVPDEETKIMYELENVIVVNYSVGGGAQSEPPAEEIILNFDTAEMVYRHKPATGEVQETRSGVNFCLGDGSVRFK